MRNINTRNKHHLHRPVANLSCFQKGASYSGIRIFNSLPGTITNLKNEKTQFKVALKGFKCTPLLFCGWIFHMHRWYVLLTVWLCTCSLHSNIFIVCMFMTCSTSYCLVTLKDLECIYVCIIIVMCDPTKKHNRSTICWHFITLYLLFILYMGMMINWFNPIHMAKAYKWEYKLCFDWCCIFPSPLHL